MREEKQSIIEEFRSGIAESSFVILVDYRGMKSSQSNELRSQLSHTSARMRVMKNNLFKLAARGSVTENIDEAVSGPLAMIFGQGDPVATAKLLKAFFREHQSPVIKTGIWQTGVLSAGDIDLLADLPPKPILYRMALGMLAAPMSQLAGVFRQRLAGLLYVLKAIEEKKNRR